MFGQFCTLVMFYDQIRVQWKPDTGLTEHLSKDTRGSRLQTSSNCAREGFCRSWLVVVHSIQPNLAVNSWKPLWVRLQDKIMASTDWTKSPIDRHHQLINGHKKTFFNSIVWNWSIFLCEKEQESIGICSTFNFRFILWPIHTIWAHSLKQILSTGLLIWHQAPNSESIDQTKI